MDWPASTRVPRHRAVTVAVRCWSGPHPSQENEPKAFVAVRLDPELVGPVVAAVFVDPAENVMHVAGSGDPPLVTGV